MTSQENKAIVRRFVREVWNGGDIAVVDELYSPEYVGHWFRPDGADADREALKAFIEAVHRGFPDYEMEIQFMHGEGDLVTVGFTAGGSHEGEFMGIPPTESGQTVARPVPGHTTARIVEGEIVEGWATWDALGLLRELGALPQELETVSAIADD
jgi:predicted ester cyclase